LDGIEWWFSEEGATETIDTRHVNCMCRWPFLCTERHNYCNNMLQRSFAPAFSLSFRLIGRYYKSCRYQDVGVRRSALQYHEETYGEHAGSRVKSSGTCVLKVSGFYLQVALALFALVVAVSEAGGYGGGGK
jgi:hypothetical protein